MTPESLLRSLENCRLALTQLEEFVTASKGTRMDRAAVIQAFEFNFETFWQCFKKVVERQGGLAPYPRLAIAGAFQMRLIADEQVWLALMNDRNKTSHIYNDAVSLSIYQAVTTSYLPAFQTALASLQKNLPAMTWP